MPRKVDNKSVPSTLKPNVLAIAIPLAFSGMAFNPPSMAADAVADDKADSLPKVTVTAEKDKETAATPVKGYVAKRVTTATKTDASILETPQAISVITRDELDMRNVQRDGDALRYTSGVFSENFGNDIRPGYDVGTIRGFDPITSGMYRDGLREPNGIWARLTTDVNTVERVEVLKGPSSVLYGQSEPAGVINRVTKKPTETPQRQIELQAGNFGRYQGSFDLSGPVDSESKVLYRVIGLIRDSGSQYKYDSGHRGPDDREVFAPSITFKPSDRTTLTLQAEYLHAKTGVPFTVGRSDSGVAFTDTSATKTMIGDYTYDKNERKQTSYGYLFEHVFNDNFTFRQNLRISDVDLQYRRMSDAFLRLGSSGNLVPRSQSIINEKLNGSALDNQAQIKFNTGSIRHTALFGIDFTRTAYTKLQGTTNAALNTLLDMNDPVYGLSFADPAFHPSSTQSQAVKQSGFYAQDQIKLDDRWVFTLSGRKDWSTTETRNVVNNTKTDQDDDKFTYRAGLAYVFDSGLAPYISHSTSFVPTIGTDVNGQALKPTTGKQNEIGIRYIPTGTSNSYTLSIFELRQQNYTINALPSYASSQVGEVRSRGIEFETKTRLMDNLNLISALTYNEVVFTKSSADGNYRVGDTPVYQPKTSASAWLDYRVTSGALAGLGLGGGVRYTGTSNGGNPFPVSGNEAFEYTNAARTIADAAISYQYNPNWRFSLNVNNLFDKQYTICGFGACQLGYDRTVIATARYSF